MSDQDKEIDDEPAVSTEASADTAQLLSSLEELASMSEKMFYRVTSIRGLVMTENFKYMSKTTRNTMLTELMDNSGDIMDGTKTVHKLLRKVKRERPPEVVVDESIILRSEKNEIG